jgi:hypothetical protein
MAWVVFSSISSRFVPRARVDGVALTAPGATRTPSPRLTTQIRPRESKPHDAQNDTVNTQVALAVGFGADGVCPRVAYEALAKLRHDGLIHAKMRNDVPSPDDVPDDAEIRKAYRKALAKGLLKVMSKMGISTLQSYKGAQIFEALGLHPDVVETCFSVRSRRPAVPSLHSNASSPGMMDVGGFFSDFGDRVDVPRRALRRASAARPSTPFNEMW